eukprot:GGOE01050322.1.p4 GENE.GGOE01050322.1~~GGOE01050322.1.p4  ORF type:complete len:101 (-),score=2.68 GGOE01050322.1:518-820(-)
MRSTTSHGSSAQRALARVSPYTSAGISLCRQLRPSGATIHNSARFFRPFFSSPCTLKEYPSMSNWSTSPAVVEQGKLHPRATKMYGVLSLPARCGSSCGG